MSGERFCQGGVPTLWVMASALSMATPSFAAEVTLDPGWHLIVYPASTHAPEPSPHLTRWEVGVGSPPSENRVRYDGIHPQDDVGGPSVGWVHVEQTTEHPILRSNALTQTSTRSLVQGWNVVWVSRRLQHCDPKIRRLQRWEPSTETYAPVALGDWLEPGVAYFAFAVGKMRFPRDCLPSTEGDRSVVQPKVQMTLDGQKAITHLAYIAQGGRGKSDRIHYRQSHTFGAPGPDAWPLGPITVAEPGPQARVLEVSIAAHGSRVDIGWIEAARTRQPGNSEQSRIIVKSSCDLGLSFNSCNINRLAFRESAAYKRDLSMSYDRHGHHHMIWNEANKVYHLRDFEGDRDREGKLLNVFDVYRRRPATEVVKYKVKRQPVHGACPCEDCWCEESYTLENEPDAQTMDLSEGPYVKWWDSVFVYAPSLHIDDDKVTIIARQHQVWSPVPVPNPIWDKMYTKPIYSDDIVEGIRPIRQVLGWRQTWKTAYEEGDESLHDTLGIRYQYRYAGRWDKDDRISLAQRPLQAGAWTEPETQTTDVQIPKTSDFGWARDLWQDDHKMRWQISTVDASFEGPLDDKPSYPVVASSSSGRMVAVYEKGASMNPNHPGGNPIVLRVSEDGGQTWLGSDTSIARGYRPFITNMTHLDEEGSETWAILYYAPLQEPPGEGENTVGTIRLALSQDLVHFTHALLNQVDNHIEPAKALHHTGYGKDADVFLGLPSLATTQDVMLAAWVKLAPTLADRDQIVTARTSFSQKNRQGSTSAPTEELPNPTFTEGSDSPTSIVHGPSQTIVAQSAPTERSAPPAVAQTSPTQGALVHAAARGLLEESPASLRLSVDRSQATLHANLHEALALRDTLRFPLQNNNQQWVQVEYLPLFTEADRQDMFQGANDLSSGGTLSIEIVSGTDAHDAEVLAGFKRVWAYTQGIALAQAVRRQEPETAVGLARWLCDHAARAGEEILGWHFSQNTDGDTWRDARLVTGATAWAVHGLGTFITSDALLSLEAKEQDAFRACYLSALRGLETHRVAVDVSTGRRHSGASPCTDCASLMTAGWTTQGLQHANAPSKLGLTEDPSERWAYYDILDAIGYDDFANTNPPSIQRTQTTAEGQNVEPQSFALNRIQFDTLRIRAQSRNVVTEHNLDVLSVLNHALAHVDQIQPENARKVPPEDLLLWLEDWRNDVRRGIFELLWDAPEDGLSYLEEKEPNRCRANKKIIERRGRILTGGQFDGTGTFLTNPEVAIDNCSWLALSVDYRTLPAERVDQLERCLTYTVEKFADHLPYGSGERCYYGTHYFPNTFHDAYIDKNNRQEDAYHLEATTGLILGLHRFSQAYPARGQRFFQEAQALWTGAQIFVRDHGFVYSSQRVQDLFARLDSSTAAIWYIDVYDALETQNEDRGHTASLWPLAGVAFAETEGFTVRARPEAVAHWSLAATEVVKQVGLKEAFKLALADIFGIVALSGLSGEVNREDIAALADQIFVEDRHSVVVVEDGVPFDVPFDFEFVGSEPHFTAKTPREIYTWPLEAVGQHSLAWVDAFSLAVVDSLGLGIHREWRQQSSQALRSFIEGYIPQDIILKKTGNGVDIYRKAHFDLSLERPRGVVLEVGPEPTGPRLLHRQPGPWSLWYEQQVLASGLPEALQEAYLRTVTAWILETLLARPGRQSFQERNEVIKAQILGKGFGSLAGGPEDQGPNKSPGAGANTGPGDDTVWRKETVRWVDPHPTLVKDGLFGLTYASTDGILSARFDEFRDTANRMRAGLGKDGVARVFEGQKIPKGSAPPIEVSEWPLKKIFRSMPVGAFIPKIGSRPLGTALMDLADDGFDLKKPLRIYTLPSGRVAIDPKDHNWLAAMNLLGEETVPVRFVLPPYEWEAGIVYPQNLPDTATSVTAANLEAARNGIYHSTVVPLKRENDVSGDQGIFPEGDENLDLWDHALLAETSSWISSVKNVESTYVKSGNKSDAIWHIVRPEGGVDINKALGYNFGYDEVVLRKVNIKNVLATYTPREDGGVFEVNLSADDPLPAAFNLATTLTQVDLSALHVGNAPKEDVSSVVRKLNVREYFAPPLLIVRKGPDDIGVMSNPVIVHALRTVEVETAPAAIIEWASLSKSDRDELIRHYGVDADGTVVEPMRFEVEARVGSESSKLFHPSSHPPEPIVLRGAKGQVLDLATAVLDDFSSGPQELDKVPSGASQGSKHAAILWGEVQRQSKSAGFTKNLGQVVGFDLGHPDETTPNDVVKAITAAVDEKRKSRATLGWHPVTVISISPKLSYRLKDHFPGATTLELNALEKEMKRGLKNAIVDATKAGILMISGAEPGAALSEAIVEAGASEDRFFQVGGTTRMATDPTYASPRHVPDGADFVAPGLAPLLTDSGITIERDAYIPVAIASATALVAAKGTTVHDLDPDVASIPEIFQQTHHAGSAGSKTPGHLSPDEVHKIVAWSMNGIPSIEEAKNTRTLLFPYKSTFTASSIIVVQHTSELKIRPLTSLKAFDVNAKDEVLLFEGDQLRDIVTGRVWNDGIVTGHITVDAQKNQVTYFGSPSLHSAGQILRFVDRTAQHEPNDMGLMTYALTTDAIAATDYESLIRQKNFAKLDMSPWGVKRILDGQEVDPDGYPKGVFEIRIEEIYRSWSVRAAQPSDPGGPNLQDRLAILAKKGFDLNHPIHVYPQPSLDRKGRESKRSQLMVWNIDHDLLAAMSLLGEHHVPVRIVPDRSHLVDAEDSERYFPPRTTSPGGATKPGSIYGVPENTMKVAREEVVEAEYVIGPDDPTQAFQEGFSADGSDPSLLNHVWNTGANSAWIFGVPPPTGRVLDEIAIDPEYRGRSLTYYLVRSRGGVALETATGLQTEKSALPSVHAREVLAAVTPHPTKAWTWTINPKASKPLPKVAQWTHELTTTRLWPLDLSTYDQEEVARLAKAVLESETVIEPLVLLKNRQDHPEILSGQAGAVVLSNMGNDSMSALVIDYKKLNKTQQSNVDHDFPTKEQRTPEEKQQNPKLPTIPKAPQLGPPSFGNLVKIGFDDAILSTKVRRRSYDFIMLVSTHDGELLRLPMTGQFSGDLTSALGAIKKNPKLFSLDVMRWHDTQPEFDLSMMMERSGKDFEDIQKLFGKGAAPRLAAGWTRQIAYLPVGKEQFHISNTTTFIPKTVSMPITLAPPTVAPNGIWESFDLSFAYEEERFEFNHAEIYFAKVDASQAVPTPQDFILFEDHLLSWRPRHQMTIDVHGPERTVRQNQTFEAFLQNFMGQSQYQLWVSARLIGQGREIQDKSWIWKTGRSRETQPIKVDVHRWLTPR